MFYISNSNTFICHFSKTLNRDRIEIWGQKCFNLKNVVCGKSRNWIGIRKIYICYRFFFPIFRIHPSIFKKFIVFRRYSVKLSEGKIYKFSSFRYREKGKTNADNNCPFIRLYRSNSWTNYRGKHA